MTGHEIRERFLAYFEGRGHHRVKSSPLLPANDPTLLFTNAGMNQFKDVFLGQEKRDYKRAASSQKCIRAGGKHNDLDEVGRTARHHTFFEMLGNFSFGDYFKAEATRFAWDLLVNEFKIDPVRLWFTVFEGDQEVPPDEDAENCWKQVGAPSDRILRFGRKDNFWQMGETGPCGPCSEIHYYMGDHPEDPEFNRAEFVNGPGDTTMEIWNLVFMQYNRSASGPGSAFRMELLPAPSVDTGAGLERLAAVLQGVESTYDTDLIKPTLEFVADLASREYVYDSVEGTSMRVLADHARATAFAIADGISPGNVGRNYVLRKIMRRAIYHGVKVLGLTPPFFQKITGFVVDFMGEAYPELIQARTAIEQTVQDEERRFARILNVGEPRLSELFERFSPELPPMIELARTYDTYGVPRDLIRVVLQRHGVEIEEDAFNEDFDRALAELQQQSASAMKTPAAKRGAEAYNRIVEGLPKTEFTGYTAVEEPQAKVLAIISGSEPLERLTEGETAEVLLDRTPFYAESGGQIGDTGVIENEGVAARVTDTFALVSGYTLHKVTVNWGTLVTGATVTARIDAERRRRIKANHTGTHLVHAALREVLGPHVKQAGSLVAPDRLRFDFSHYQPLSEEEILEIERLVNQEILHNRVVQTEIKPIEDALRSGAMALFGEKYASEVRVVSVPGFSTELCGGTHVHATGDIGPFKIVSDSSIASGVRRIEAITADDAVARFQSDERILKMASERLKTQASEIPDQIEKLQDQVRRAEREIEALKMKLALAAGSSSSEDVKEIASGVKVLSRRVEGMDANGLRQLADNLSGRIKPGVVVLGQAADGKASLVVRVSDELTAKLNAGKIVKEISLVVGGKGGGRADMATGGGSQVEHLDAALTDSYLVIDRMLLEK